MKGSGPEVYVLENGTRHWVTDIEVFNSFNFNWGNIKKVSDLILESYPQADNWKKGRKFPDGSLLRGSGPEVYLIELGKNVGFLQVMFLKEVILDGNIFLI